MKSLTNISWGNNLKNLQLPFDYLFVLDTRRLAHKFELFFFFLNFFFRIQQNSTNIHCMHNVLRFELEF